jgi:DNA-binding transcriptional ArsR family regulator
VKHIPISVWRSLAIAETHPLRVQLLDLIAASDAPLSPKQLSDATGEKLGNVSFHCGQLRDKGLIELRRTEAVRGALAHYYGMANS